MKSILNICGNIYIIKIEFKKATDPIEDPDRFWLETEDLDYDELKKMSKKKRNKILKEHGFEPDEFFFDDFDD